MIYKAYDQRKKAYTYIEVDDSTDLFVWQKENPNYVVMAIF